jgi:hypothetical protein
MADEKRKLHSIRPSLISAAVAATLQPQPTIGGDQGSFMREPCGTCLSWKRLPERGLNVGACMWGPPIAFPMPRGDGSMAQVLSRSTMSADQEGCDQHDDGTDEDGEGEPGEPGLLKTG